MTTVMYVSLKRLFPATELILSPYNNIELTQTLVQSSSNLGWKIVHLVQLTGNYDRQGVLVI